jgi:iron complex transport system permease protein
LIAVGAVLVAIAVAAAGPIGFVALMAPNVARLLAGTSGSTTLPVVALTGAVLVVGSDLAARAIFSTEELPVGVVTAVLGGPFFLFLLLRGSRVRSG